MRMKKITDPRDFEEYLDDYLMECAHKKKNPSKFDRFLVEKASAWIGWLNDDHIFNRCYIRELEKQVKELGGTTR